MMNVYHKYTKNPYLSHWPFMQPSVLSSVWNRTFKSCPEAYWGAAMRFFPPPKTVPSSRPTVLWLASTHSAGKHSGKIPFGSQVTGNWKEWQSPLEDVSGEWVQHRAFSQKTGWCPTLNQLDLIYLDLLIVYFPVWKKIIFSFQLKLV